MRRGARAGGAPVDLRTRVGTVELANPVMTAAGTAGHGDELAAHVDLAALGAVVVKSLHAGPWAGNPAPRLCPTPAGMLNSVGLQGPGVEAWLSDDLPALASTGARIVVSIWGRSIAEYRDAAELLADAPPSVVAVEVNVSCPNQHDAQRMFAQSPTATTEAIEATAACGRPRWAKLSPAVADLPAIADAARRGGAEAVTLINTMPGLAIDVERRTPRLGAGPGGLSGPAIHPVAVRAVWETHRAHPTLPIVGVGGVTKGEDAIELLLAGASAVQVGTASFADPRSVQRVAAEVASWCHRHGVAAVSELVGAAQPGRSA